MKNLLRCVAIACAVFSFFVSTVSAQDAVETIVRENTESKNTAIVNVRTNISGVEIYINNLYKGIAPLTVEEMVPGLYTIHLRKDGWERKTVYVELKAQTETNLYFELVPITGFLRIYSNIKDANIYLDDVLLEQKSSLDSGLIEIQEGSHTVKIEKFGYETQSKTVTIFDSFLSEVGFSMEKSVFAVRSFSSNPLTFNPLTPGNLGTAKFSFTISAPGSALFEILDKNGVAIFTQQFSNLVSEYHSVTWNGRNSLGIALPEGIYRARLSALPSEGWESTVVQDELSEGVSPIVTMTETIIDNSIFYPLLTSGAGGSTVGIPNARLMPVGSTLISINAAVDFSTASGFQAFPFLISANFTPFSMTEFSLRLGAESADSSFPVFFGGSFKVSGKLENGYIGGIIRYTYATEPTYLSVYSEPGLGVGVIGALEYGHMLFSVSEEVVFGSEQGNVAAFDGHLKSALGVQYQKGIFSSNVWASLYSPFFTSGMQLFSMVESGAEVSVLIPNTTVVPTVGCSYVYSKDNEHDVVLRLGVNFILQ